MARARNATTLSNDIANTFSGTETSLFWCVVLYCTSPKFSDQLQVNGFLYCVHRFFFCRDSVYFSTRFDQLGVRDHEASSIIVLLGDVECKDFEAFLSVLYPS